ncbi:hypothetical protein [Pseudoalteromonas phenolica]|uniref:hypothetical protein n=1 Tax=Pseudoalteromonas phenolica TaxID=161398 RepID=UPI00384C668E
MISYIHLDLKLEKQATLLSTSLNIPIKIAKDALARAIYCETDYQTLESSLYENINLLKSKQVMLVDWLKYLLIGEGVDDKRLISELQKCVDFMANRLANIVVINISKLQLISKIFLLFGLDNEAKYIINTELELTWKPIFNILNKDYEALYSTIKLGDVSFCLIAVRYFEEKYDLFAANENFKKALLYSTPNEDGLLEEAKKVEFLKIWFLNTHSVLNNEPMFQKENHPHAFNIKNKKYLVYGFPLSSKLCEDLGDSVPLVDIRVRNLSEEQTFILKFGNQRLTLLAKRLDDSHVIDHVNYCEFTYALKESLLTHKDARKSPYPMYESLFSFVLRPYRDADFIKNTV